MTVEAVQKKNIVSMDFDAGAAGAVLGTVGTASGVGAGSAVVVAAREGEVLRPYQQWLHDRAAETDDNAVVVLPTGVGKTRVAFELVATALRRHPQRAVVFLCPNVNLVSQQAGYFEIFLKTANLTTRQKIRVVQAAGGSGKTGKDELKRLGFSRQAAARECSSLVIFATDGTFSNVVKATVEVSRSTLQTTAAAAEAESAKVRSRVFSRISLLVLDECHHTVRMAGSSKSGEADHDYSTIARLYRLQAPSERPKILGLTASPGEMKGDVKNLLGDLKARLLYPPASLAVAFAGQSKSTVTVQEVVAGGETALLADFIMRMEEDGKEVQRAFAREEISTEQHQSSMKDISNCIKLFRCIGWGDRLIELLKTSSVGAAAGGGGRKRGGGSFGEDFEHYNKAILKLLLAPQKRGDATPCSAVDGTRSASENKGNSKSRGRTQNSVFGESPVLRAVKQRLAAANAAGPLRAIVFVATIDAAHCMQEALKPLRSEVLVGQTEQTKSTQKSVVADFHAGVFNVLVATSVAEEGLDIRQCNLVIRTEKPQSIISNIQARGRARQKDAQYVIKCLHEDEVDEVKELGVREEVARTMLEEMLTSEDADIAVLGDDAGTNWSCYFKQNSEGGEDDDQVGEGTYAGYKAKAARGDGGEDGETLDDPPSYSTAYWGSQPHSSVGGGCGSGIVGGGMYDDDDAVDGLFGSAAGDGSGGMSDSDLGDDAADDDGGGGVWRDFKSDLNIYLQQHLSPHFSKGIVAKYALESATGPPHDRTFVSKVTIGTHVFCGEPCKTKKDAEQSAARAARKALQKQ